MTRCILQQLRRFVKSGGWLIIAARSNNARVAGAEMLPFRDGQETQAGADAAQGQDKPNDAARLENVERLARKARRTLSRSLLMDPEARAQLGEVSTEILARQIRVTEWGQLVFLLNEVSRAMAPFRASLAWIAPVSSGATRRQVLLPNWRLCQDAMDRLVGFSEGITSIGQPYRKEGDTLLGAPWAVELEALRLLLEDALTDDSPCLAGLSELADGFIDACQRHLTLAVGELQDAIGGLRRLSASLLGDVV